MDASNPRPHPTAPQKPAPNLPLLSVARGQTFDLLLHLTLNLPQPIRLTGPLGIGKTHFLKALAKKASAYLTVCYQTASTGLSLERLLDAVSQEAELALQQSGHLAGSALYDIQSLLEIHARNKRSLVVLLDDAQLVLPGFLDGLSQFAGLNPALKLVIALDSTAVTEKNVTDAEFMTEAFPVEIPPLDNLETSAYIRQIVATTPAFLPGETFNTAIQEQVFRSSGGIPGQIAALLEQPITPARKNALLAHAQTLALTGLLIALTAGLTLYFGPNLAPVDTTPPVQPQESTPPQHPDTILIPAPPEPIPPAVVAPQPEQSFLPAAPLPLTPEVKPPTPAAATPEPQTRQPEAPLKPPVEAINTGDRPITEKPQEPAPSLKPATKPPQSAPVVVAPPPTTPPVEAHAQAKIEGTGWITTRPPAHYTLQVATATTDAQIQKFLADHPEGQAWSSIHLRQGKRDLYPVFQGEYPNQTSAAEALRQWERRGKKAFIRSFSSLQQAIRSAESPTQATAEGPSAPAERRAGRAAPIKPRLTPPTSPPITTAQEQPISTLQPAAPEPPPVGVTITPLSEAPEPTVENSQPDQPDQPDQDETDEDNPDAGTESPGEEIYYRLIDGQPPEVLILNPAKAAQPEEASVRFPVQVQSSKPATEVQHTTPPLSPALHQADWILTQNPEQYTVQIITVSSVQSRDQVVRMFPPVATIASFSFSPGQNTVYPVFYGVFADAASARAALGQIPKQLGSKPIIRQFKTLHNQINRLASSQPQTTP
ncbi:MAG: hypothetical protein ACR2HF_11070 [Methylococcaceae bacterium]